MFVFESSGSAKYAVVQVPLRFRFDREVLVFSQAAPLPEVGWGRGKENKRASGRAGERRLRSLVSCARAITHACTHIHTGRDPQKHIRTHMHTQRYRRRHKNTHTLSFSLCLCVFLRAHTHTKTHAHMHTHSLSHTPTYTSTQFFLSVPLSREREKVCAVCMCVYV